MVFLFAFLLLRGDVVDQILAQTGVGSLDLLGGPLLPALAGLEAVVAAGMADYSPGKAQTLRAVFEQADARMYDNKKELKTLGARTR